MSDTAIANSQTAGGGILHGTRETTTDMEKYSYKRP